VTAPADSAPRSSLPPLGLRVAATLCAVVGVLSTLAAVGMSAEMAGRPHPVWVSVVLNPLVGLAVCAAAVLVWRGRRAAGYLLAASCILPNLGNLAYGKPLRPPGLLLLLAIITVAANWKLLR
jgi:hypothetical protein